MRYLLFFSLLICLPLVTSCKFLDRNIFSKDQTSGLIMLRHKQDSIMIADSLRIIQEDQFKLENFRLDSVRKEDEIRKVLNSRLRYKIIVGSFTNFQNARDFSESYRARGFNTDIIAPSGDSVEYVAAEAYDNQKKAMDRLREFKATIEPKAWLYVAK